MADGDRIRKLRWLCRRGMKELDVLLEGFVATHQAALADGAWPQMETLLAAEDDVLWDWIQNPAATQDDTLFTLLVTIRDEHAAAH
jgi:antitoxin CptB